MVKRRRKLPFARSRTSLLILALSISSLLLLLTGRDQFGGEETILKKGLDSEQIRREGHRLYNANCLNCHGVNGRGTSFGPPLVHPLYGASTLPDQAFAQAVLYGVEEQHWSFGAMAPIKTLNQVEIAQILAYVRVQQRDAKIP